MFVVVCAYKWVFVWFYVFNNKTSLSVNALKTFETVVLTLVVVVVVIVINSKRETKAISEISMIIMWKQLGRMSNF